MAPRKPNDEKHTRRKDNAFLLKLTRHLPVVQAPKRVLGRHHVFQSVPQHNGFAIILTGSIHGDGISDAQSRIIRFQVIRGENLILGQKQKERKRKKEREGK